MSVLLKLFRQRTDEEHSLSVLVKYWLMCYFGEGCYAAGCKHLYNGAFTWATVTLVIIHCDVICAIYER